MVQPIRSRKVYYFDPAKACFPYLGKVALQIPEGHFEKVTKDANKYWFNEGFKPSGVKGALVVSKAEANFLPVPEPRITNRY